MAAAVLTSMPGNATWDQCIIGNTYDSLGNFSKAIEYAIEYHVQNLTIAKDVGDRAEAGQGEQESRVHV